jgi:glycosyltransferase involved in cell wall biosynthesis
VSSGWRWPSDARSAPRPDGVAPPDWPRLTIVVPVHDIATYLPECLNSILTNAPERLQVVCVDDASSDGAGPILDDIASNDARVVVLHLPRNAGLGRARNAGLERATGDYVWFVDGDDRLPPGAVAAVMARLTALHPDLLLLDHRRLQPSGRLDADPHEAPVGRFPGTIALGQRPRLLDVRQAAWNRVLHRELIESHGLRFPGGWYEDVEFSHLALLRAQRIGSLGRVGYHYRVRTDGAITSTRSARHFEVFAQYERLFARVDRRRPGRRPVDAAIRARLFELMIEHYLVIVGTPTRIPTHLRPAFFTRMVEHYRRYQPSPDYVPPRGWNGVKHRFVRWDAYPVFAAARNVYRAGRQATRMGRPSP